MFQALFILLVGLTVPTMADNGKAAPIILEANEAPPFWSSQMPYSGMAGEIVHAMAKSAGIPTKIIFKPLSRLIEDDTNNDLGNPAFFMVNPV